MRLKYMLGIILIAALHQSNCQRPHRFSEDSSQDNALDIVADSVTNLAQKISRVIVGDRSKTEIFSPVSIAGALSLLLLGSGGTTRTELMELMGFSNSTIRFTEIHKGFGKLFGELVSNNPSLKANVPWRENDTCNNVDYDDFTDSRSSFQKETKGRRHRRDADLHLIAVANGVFVNQDLPISSSYAMLARTLYGAEIQQLEFGRNPTKTASIINQWVREKTRNKIQEIVSSNQVNDIPMVLASALYFKAKWETMFIEPDTKPRPFYINGKNAPPVDAVGMATSGCFPYYDAEEIDAKVVGLPYQEGKSTMYILMPNNSSRTKLASLIQGGFRLQQFNQMIDKMQVKTGTIAMPKMKLESTIGLKEVLIGLGVRTIFDPQTSNLTGLTRNTQGFEEPGRRRPSTTSKKPEIDPVTSTAQGFGSPDRRRPSTTPKQPEIESSTTVPAPIVFPPQVRLTVTLKECNSFNNCKLNRSTCFCDLRTRGPEDARGCHIKPLYVASQCPTGTYKKPIYNAEMCMAESYNILSEPRHERCSQNGCHFISNVCYCCKYKPSPTPTDIPKLQQPQQFKPENNQQFRAPEPTVQPFEVSQRLNSANQNSPQNNPRLDTSQCQTIQECRNQYDCYFVTRCPVINDLYAQNQRQETRYKRQSGNNERPSMYVGQIIHKVSLDINEEGTEGGAVSTVVIDRISSSFTIRIDGPYIIYLRNDVTKLPLFYGPVYDPRS
ncbi:serine protease inhibitor 28Dc-like isoform X1 [Wyeomyia smithii]|uniref:serine protease inhibitor 28Dc-like isoform X1 n=1 Tax=Wyeomyia smithii TaxID=174621 RepID=UPI0024681905|nr:serine protease inhibitor 28Dc-like isoform X1 [Wyeomyia smithii]